MEIKISETRRALINTLLEENNLRKTSTSVLAANIGLEVAEDALVKDLLKKELAENIQLLEEKCNSLERQISEKENRLKEITEFMNGFECFHKNLIDSMSDKQRSAISAYTYMMSIASASKIPEVKQSIMMTANEYFIFTMTGKQEVSK